MLVLTRGEGQRIFVGDDVVVTVVRVRGGQVRVGIDAPPRIPIRRGELAPLPSNPGSPHEQEPAVAPQT